MKHCDYINHWGVCVNDQYRAHLAVQANHDANCVLVIIVGLAFLIVTSALIAIGRK